MNERDLEGQELEKRARLFKPWLEEEATKLYFDIVKRKTESLIRQLKNAKPDVSREIMCNIQGKIEAQENMVYLPRGVLKSYDRAKAEAESKREKEKE